MTEYKNSKGSFLFVEVPVNAGFIKIDKYGDLEFDPDTKSENGSWEFLQLPTGCTYTFLFTTNTATQEDAKGVVERTNDFFNRNHPSRYEDYTNSKYQFKSTLESLHSLIKHLGMQVEGNWAVLKIK